MPLELQLVEWLRQNFQTTSAIKLGIGDDMAIIEIPRSIEPQVATSSTPILISSDMLLDGVHFDTKSQPFTLIGRKAIACSLSDCAAMAVRPLAVTVSLAIPATQSLEQTQELFRGMQSIAEEFETAIAGGDTTSWSHPLAIDIAIVATPFDGVEPVKRSGARCGDLVCVTGPLGGSLRGRHLTFTPRVREAKQLAGHLDDRLHAMMDISDGLSLDLWRMCQSSGVGAVLDSTRLMKVISEDATLASREDSQSSLEHTLTDGEDFELLAAISPDAFSEESAQPSQFDCGGVNVFVVGQFTQDEDGFHIRQGDGALTRLEPKGYVH